jgi:hypothetical protein
VASSRRRPWSRKRMPAISAGCAAARLG